MINDLYELQERLNSDCCELIEVLMHQVQEGDTTGGFFTMGKIKGLEQAQEYLFDNDQ
jgi:hypothetical protein